MCPLCQFIVDLCHCVIKHILYSIQKQNNVLYLIKITKLIGKIKYILAYLKYVTLEHKTSHEGQFFETEIYASSES